MAPQLAWLGLGNMGRGMCKNLVERGDLGVPLILYNRTAARTEKFSAELGADKTKVARSVEEAVRDADIIWTCLGDDAAICDIFATVLKGDVRGKLFVDASTVHPDTTDALAKEVEAHGAQFVACPVFGAPAMADAGQLVCVLAGPADAVARVQPYCKGVIGRAEFNFAGQPASKALQMKVVGNIAVLNMVESLAETHALAQKIGLGAEQMHAFYENVFPGPFEAYSKRMLTGDYYEREEPLFSVDHARKDAAHALSLAREVGARLPALEVADAHLIKVKEYMGLKGDIAGIYGVARQEAGLAYESKH